MSHEAKRRSPTVHPLTKMQRLELENRKLKQALCKLKIVQSLHPEQLNDQNMHGNGVQSSCYQCPGRNEGVHAISVQEEMKGSMLSVSRKK